MKKISVSMLLFSVFQLTTFAQEEKIVTTPVKVREIGVNFSDFNSFGLRYKTGGSKSILRFTLLSINGGNVKTNPDTLGTQQNNFGAGFRIGIEKRKAITEKLIFYHGLDLITSYFNTKSNTQNSSFNQVSNTWNTSTGLGLVIGLNYNISPNFLVAAEVVPSITYNYGEVHRESSGVTTNYSTSGISYGLSNLGANLTLAYRFGK